MARRQQESPIEPRPLDEVWAEYLHAEREAAKATRVLKREMAKIFARHPTAAAPTGPQRGFDFATPTEPPPAAAPPQEMTVNTTTKTARAPRNAPAGRAKPLTAEAIAVLGSIDLDGGIARITTGKLERPVYVEVNAALESLGGKWNKKQKGHLFADPADLTERLEALVLAGHFVNPQDMKKLLGWFATPKAVVERVHELAGLDQLQPGARLLEPSAGEGALLEGLDGIGLATVAVELDLGRIETLRKALSCTKVIAGDFLCFSTNELGGRFDRIIANPSFQKQADLDHVRHAFGMLKPGGRLISIMAGSVKWRDNAKTKAFREEMLEPHGSIVEELPRGTFAESGTDVNAVIVQLERPA